MKYLHAPFVGGHRVSARAGILVVLALVAFVFVPTARAVPPPDADPFYAASVDLADHRAGAILRTRSIVLYGLPLPVSAWQVQYRTNDANGLPIAGMTTVLVPNWPWFGPGQRPLLSYQIAEDSLGTRCAPSYALRGGWDLGGANTFIDTPFIAEALRRGWAVVTSDYEGPQSRFLDGVNAGRAVLDGIRAARALAPDGVGPASPVGGWGYSGGAFATLWAAQMQSEYAPDVQLAGVTAGGIPADWPAMVHGVDGGTQAGLAMLALTAIAKNEPNSGVLELLNERGRSNFAEDVNACGPDFVIKYINAHVDDFATVPDVLSHPDFRAAIDRQELGGGAPVAPMYLYHSTTDDVIPVAGFTDLLGRYCAQGADITSVHSTLPGHNLTAIGEAAGAMGYLADRFAGVPVAPGCHGR
ncbi:lipase family protein [Nocardia sp. NBC_00565]|uniref:lipase family protein n=1 Tax=Nocardia sp. NBC_00565 TaxID=2975993 RepID=UPI002E812E32|nr:lipase family protein [Nocardia sp. NBC_00565]WUC02686.1 lipase family protein [Nocardia sp. NBC_00565]